MLFFGRFRGQADIIFISPAREWDFWFRLNLNMNRALLESSTFTCMIPHWYMLIWTSVKHEFWICQFQLVLCCSVLYSTTHGMIETHGMNWKTFFCEQEWSHNWAQQCDYANPLPAESVMYLQSTCTCRMNLCIISYFKPSNIVSIHSAHSMCYVYIPYSVHSYSLEEEKWSVKIAETHSTLQKWMPPSYTTQPYIP